MSVLSSTNIPLPFPPMGAIKPTPSSSSRISFIENIGSEISALRSGQSSSIIIGESALTEAGAVKSQSIPQVFAKLRCSKDSPTVEVDEDIHALVTQFSSLSLTEKREQSEDHPALPSEAQVVASIAELSDDLASLDISEKSTRSGSSDQEGSASRISEDSLKEKVTLEKSDLVSRDLVTSSAIKTSAVSLEVSSLSQIASRESMKTELALRLFVLSKERRFWQMRLHCCLSYSDLLSKKTIPAIQEATLMGKVEPSPIQFHQNILNQTLTLPSEWSTRLYQTFLTQFSTLKSCVLTKPQSKEYREKLIDFAHVFLSKEKKAIFEKSVKTVFDFLSFLESTSIFPLLSNIETDQISYWVATKKFLTPKSAEIREINRLHEEDLEKFMKEAQEKYTRYKEGDQSTENFSAYFKQRKKFEKAFFEKKLQYLDNLKTQIMKFPMQTCAIYKDAYRQLQDLLGQKGDVALFIQQTASAHSVVLSRKISVKGLNQPCFEKIKQVLTTIEDRRLETVDDFGDHFFATPFPLYTDAHKEICFSTLTVPAKQPLSAKEFKELTAVKHKRHRKKESKPQEAASSSAKKSSDSDSSSAKRETDSDEEIVVAKEEKQLDFLKMSFITEQELSEFTVVSSKKEIAKQPILAEKSQSITLHPRVVRWLDESYLEEIRKEATYADFSLEQMKNIRSWHAYAPAMYKVLIVHGECFDAFDRQCFCLPGLVEPKNGPKKFCTFTLAWNKKTHEIFHAFASIVPFDVVKEEYIKSGKKKICPSTKEFSAQIDRFSPPHSGKLTAFESGVKAVVTQEDGTILTAFLSDERP